MNIRGYNQQDEKGWVRCRLLSFLDTAYFDNVLREKETYENPSIELVAVEGKEIIGLLDIEYEQDPKTVCSHNTIPSGMIWHIAVHPDHQRKGVATALLSEAKQILKKHGIKRMEAWTRDDDWVNKWYEAHHFKKKDSYYHVFMEGVDETKIALKSEIEGLHPVLGFAHYVGSNIEEVKGNFKRVHECRMYELML
ncbi:GNAT family N-acetyltransferase [Evansella sp. AB-P1]|uniref:GNAT family N-acetyltransferase n=1 Tax=Evansella sp. AB-P1 TaxID=3037653 RepID=UPI00241F793B|nr:GNAT family N-acetyltransferase [Evansella sp. AB-P1]MDG5788406.1 GNAT family N-acetyltransferase [Evansella sp. AB-P1]